MTIIKHSTNPAIFVGTPDEFGLAVEGDFSAAGHWIASVNGQETGLMCLDAEQAMREGERVFEAEASSLAYTAKAEAAMAASRVVPNSDEQTEIELIQSKLTVLREAINALVDQLIDPPPPRLAGASRKRIVNPTIKAFWAALLVTAISLFLLVALAFRLYGEHASLPVALAIGSCVGLIAQPILKRRFQRLASSSN